MKSARSFLLFSLLLCFGVTNAQSPTAPASGFNLFTKQGATVRSSHAEGPAAVGGDLTIAGDWGVTFNVPGTFQVGGKTIGLVVGGKVVWQSGNQFHVNNGTYVKIGDGTGTTVWYYNDQTPPINTTNLRITPSTGGWSNSLHIGLTQSAAALGVSSTVNPVIEPGVINFTSAFNTLESNSTAMGALTDNAIVYNVDNISGGPISHTNMPNKIRLFLNPGLNVLNVNYSDIQNLQEIGFDNSTPPSATRYLVINVMNSGSVSWSGNFNAVGLSTGGSYATGNSYSHILWNFPNLTGNLTISGSAWAGTVFAPFANVYKSGNSNIEGQVIAKQFIMNSGSGGELHPWTFLPTVLPTGSAPSTSICASPTTSSFTTPRSTVLSRRSRPSRCP
ncbi:MAG: choice-of-anchor A family protein, partial [Sphingobacteriales bacterium]